MSLSFPAAAASASASFVHAVTSYSSLGCITDTTYYLHTVPHSTSHHTYLVYSVLYNTLHCSLHTSLYAHAVCLPLTGPPR
ncbi:hypothetical protein LY76DRAFT_589217 [Colletotrichum caudatum]|nr:hypothetical protein LY76DRAFT_589217 [Colletotrichum caudatum]